MVRSGESLQKALNTLNKLEVEASKWCEEDGDLISSLEIRNMIAVGKLIATAALTREESRGTHYRIDYPQRRDNVWLKFVCIKLVNGQMTVELKNI